MERRFLLTLKVWELQRSFVKSIIKPLWLPAIERWRLWLRNSASITRQKYRGRFLIFHIWIRIAHTSAYNNSTCLALLGRKQRRRMPGLHLLRLKMPKWNRFNVVAVLFEKERQGEMTPSAGNLKYCAFILSNHLIVLTYFIDPKHQINKQASSQKQHDLLRSFPFNNQQN